MVASFRGRKTEYMTAAKKMSLEKMQNDILVLDRRTFLGLGARFSLANRRNMRVSSREGIVRIQAFHKPN